MKNTLPKPRQSAAQTVPATFTLRDLNRQTAKVIEACDAAGVVHIRTRDGRFYTLQPDAAPPVPSAPVTGIVESRQEYRKRLREAGFVPLTLEETERFYRIIAGEE